MVLHMIPGTIMTGTACGSPARQDHRRCVAAGTSVFCYSVRDPHPMFETHAPRDERKPPAACRTRLRLPLNSRSAITLVLSDVRDMRKSLRIVAGPASHASRASVVPCLLRRSVETDPNCHGPPAQMADLWIP